MTTAQARDLPVLQTLATAAGVAAVVALPLLRTPDLSMATSFFSGASATGATAGAAAALLAWTIAAAIVLVSAVSIVRAWLSAGRQRHPTVMAIAVLVAAVLICAVAFLHRRGADSVCCAGSGSQMSEVLRLVR